MNKYLSYSFLYDDPQDLKCDFEILTDEISSMIGFLRSLLKNTDPLRSDLQWLNEIVYHINPSLRTKIAVTEDELTKIENMMHKLKSEIESALDGFSAKRKLTFVLPQGCTAACYSHIIRNKFKSLVRLLYRHKENALSALDNVPPLLFNFCNILSGYFYFLSLYLNKACNISEIEFKSRVY